MDKRIKQNTAQLRTAPGSASMADEVISRRGGTKGRTRLLCKREKKKNSYDDVDWGEGICDEQKKKHKGIKK